MTVSIALTLQCSVDELTDFVIEFKDWRVKSDDVLVDYKDKEFLNHGQEYRPCIRLVHSLVHYMHTGDPALLNLSIQYNNLAVSGKGNGNIRTLFGVNDSNLSRFFQIIDRGDRGLQFRAQCLQKGGISLRIRYAAYVDYVTASEDEIHLILKCTEHRLGQIQPQPLSRNIARQLHLSQLPAADPSETNSQQPEVDTEQSLESIVDGEAAHVANAELDWIIRSNNELILPFSADRATSDLDRVYTALMVDPTCLAERMAHYQLMMDLAWEEAGVSPDEAHDFARSPAGLRSLLDSFDFVPEPFEGLQTTGDLLTIGEAYRDHRCLVVLGDPGSGKTTIARWLTLTMAKAWQRDDSEAVVDLTQVDPESEPDDDAAEKFSLGKPRFPFLVRAREFAAFLADDAQESKTLNSFIGHHRDPIYRRPTYLSDHAQFSEDVSTASRARFAKFVVRDGRALVVVDGLDEVANLEVRETLRNAIDEFIKSHVLKQSDSENSGDGNRILITSRIAGYNFCPLSQTLMHVIVQPMGRSARRFFFRNWLAAVDKVSRVTAENTHDTADFLEAQIQERGPKVEAIAANPLQAGALAAVFRHNRYQLPETRIEIYQLAVQRFFALWIERLRRSDGLIAYDESELTVLLENVAIGIHNMPDRASGLIELHELERMLHKTRTESVDGIDVQLSKQEKETLAELISIFTNDVGLLAERAEGVFGFLVLPIQEYFVAGHLARGESEHVAAGLRRHLDDTRFSEPIVMAIAQLAQNSPNRVVSILRQFVRADEQIDDLIPIAAITAATAFAEISWLSKEAAIVVIEQLLIGYSSSNDSTKSPVVQDIVQESLSKLHAIAPNLVHVVLGDLISVEPTLASGTAELLQKVDACWMTQPISEALFDATEHDSVDSGYPIHQIVRRRGLDQLHSVRPFTMRSYLESSPEALEFLKGDPDWLRLMIMLYGGLADHGTDVAARQYFEYSNYLQLDDADRYSLERQFAWGFGADETVYKIAVFLDTGGGHWKRIKESVEFSASFIDRDSPLTRGLTIALRNRTPGKQLLGQLKEIHNDPSHTTMLHDVRTALFALGDSATIRELATSTSQVNEGFRRQLAERASAITDSVFRAARSIPELFGSVDNAKQADRLVPLLCESIANATGIELLVGDSAPGNLLPELLIARLSGRATEDSVNSSAVFADTHTKRLAGSPTVVGMLSAMSRSPTTGALNAWSWPIPAVPPVVTDTTSVPSCVIDAIQTLPFVVSFARSWLLLETLTPLLEDRPALLPEFMAAAVGDNSDYSRSYYKKLRIEFAECSRVELRSKALDLSDRLECPYHFVRANLRLGTCWPEKTSDLIAAANDALSKIELPEQKQEVLEFALRRFDPPGDASWFEAAFNAAELIEDPDNRARAFARLTAVADEARREELLILALESTEAIPVFEERAETLRLIRHLCQIYPESRLRLKQQTEEFANEELTAYASGDLRDTVSLLEEFIPRNEPQYIIHSSLLTLAAGIADLNLGGAVSVNKLWVRFCTDPDPESMRPLLMIGESQILDLSLVAALVIDRLRVTRGVGWILPLFRVVQHPTPDTLAVLRYWRSLKVDQQSTNIFLDDDASTAVGEMKRLSSLLIAEAQGVSATLVAGVAELLTNSNDRIRYRARRCFAHERRSKKRHMHVSLLGHETIEAIAAQLLTSQHKGQGLCLSWCLATELRHDVPEFLSAWIHSIEEGASNAIVAHTIISRIEAVSDDCWQVYLTGLLSKSETVVTALLESLAYMARCTVEDPPDTTQLDEDKLKDLLAVLPQVQCQALNSLRIHECLEDSILRTVEHHVEHTESFDPSRTLKTFAAHEVPLTEFLNVEAGEELLTRLKAIGSTFYKPEAHELYLAEAASRTRDLPVSACIPILVDWLDSLELPGRSGKKLDPWTECSAEIMLLVAGIATEFPNQFLQNVDAAKLGPIALTHAVNNRKRWGRSAALLILGALRTSSPEVISVITTAMLDSQDVVDGAMRAASLLRRIESRDILSLIGSPDGATGLYQASAISSYAAARVLESVGSSPWCSANARRTIMKGLADAARDEKARRIVHFGFAPGNLPKPPRLEEEFLRVLVVISGLTERNATRKTSG